MSFGMATATVAPADAATKSISIRVNDASVTYGKTVTLSGTGTGLKAKTLTLYYYSSGKWRSTSKSTRTNASTGKYVLTFRPRVGTNKYRLAYRTIRSRSLSIRALRSVRVSLSPRGEYYKSSAATFKAALSYGKKGSKARLQRYGGSWKAVKSVRFTKSGKQTVSFGKITTPKGRWEYRVLTSADSTHAAGDSRKNAKTAVHRVACDNGYYNSKPESGNSVFFTKPGAYPTRYAYKRTHALADGITKFVCSAARDSKIKIAMWHIDDDAYYSVPPNLSNKILSAIDYVQRSRNVKVTFVLDAKTGKKAATTNWLKQMSGGRYYVCARSCMSDQGYDGVKATSGQEHQKLVTISNTSAGVPATLVSTGNWSYWQLRDYWNSGVVLWGNQKIYDRSVSRLDNMVASASRKSGFAPAWWGQSEPEDKLVQGENYASTHTWVPTVNEKAGDAGTFISFSPLNPKPADGAGLADPLLDRLAEYSCTQGGSGVKVAMLFASGATGEKFADTMTTTRAAGCTGQVIISKPVNPGSVDTVQTDQKTYEKLKAALGNNLNCVAWMHAKNILVDGSYKGAAREQTLWTGPRNFNFDGTSVSDETSLRFTGTYASKPKIYGEYLADFNNAWASGTVCPDTYSAFKNMR